MRSKPRTLLAMALMALALLSGAWTASLGGGGSPVAVAASIGSATPLPGGEPVPSQAIQAPASVPVPGVIAPSVPRGAADAVVTSASTAAIPAPALAAYQRGAQIIDAADTTCHLTWELLAAIGRVESDHGRYAGNTVSAAGISTPGIYGPELDGQGSTAAVRDTDGGVIDGDPVWDRAVGPMQFIPSTWQVVKVDADGDGKRDPQDINDAALATGVYLCSGTDDLATRQGQESGVFRYNHSTAYVDLVLRITEAYGQGDYSAVPSGTYGGTMFSPSYATALSESHQGTKTKQLTAKTLAHSVVVSDTPPVPASAAQAGGPTAVTAAVPSGAQSPSTAGPGTDSDGSTSPAGAPSGLPTDDGAPAPAAGGSSPGSDPTAAASSTPSSPSATPSPVGPTAPSATPTACSDDAGSLAATAVRDYVQAGQQSGTADPPTQDGCAGLAQADLAACVRGDGSLAGSPVALATCVEDRLGGVPTGSGG